MDGILQVKAKLLGTLRAATYAVNGKSISVVEDGTPTTVGFAAGPDPSLATVITTINALVPGVASDENGFLVLKADTSIEVRSVVGSEDAPAALGLYANTPAYAGDIAQLGHIDPTRQVALPGQLAPLWGEELNADTFNRAMIQVALDSGANYNLFHNKRVAAKKVFSVSVTAGQQSFQLTTDDPIDYPYTGDVYTGPDSLPSANAIEDLVAVLDVFGNEVVQELRDVLDTVASPVCAVEAGTNRQIVTVGSSIFTSGDPEAEFYVVITGLVGGAALNNKPLKILEFISATSVVVSNVNPSTGLPVPLNETATSLDRVEILTEKQRITGFYKEVGLTTRVEALQDVKTAATNVDAIHLNSRIYCSAADFVADDVKPGDLVVLAGDTCVPYSNAGTYRVKSVVDAKTLELVAEDYSPVFLNSSGSLLGTAAVSTDGKFWNKPYLKFQSAAVGSATWQIVFLGASTMYQATEDVDTYAGSVRRDAEASESVQRAIIGLAGPSSDSIADVLSWIYEDRRNNLENTINQLGAEHHRDDGEGAGRHSNIHPDAIGMFPGVLGETVTIRAAAGDSGTVNKVVLRSSLGVGLFSVDASGSVHVGDAAVAAPSSLYDLQVQTATNAYAIVQGDAGDAMLDVYSDSVGLARITVGSLEGDARLQLTGSGTGSSAWLALRQDTLTEYWYLRTVQGNQKLGFDYNGAIYLSMDGATGNTGIGTDSPTFKLDILGGADTLRVLGGVTQNSVRAVLRTYNNNIGEIVASYPDNEFIIRSLGSFDLRLAAANDLVATAAGGITLTASDGTDGIRFKFGVNTWMYLDADFVTSYYKLQALDGITSTGTIFSQGQIQIDDIEFYLDILSSKPTISFATTGGDDYLNFDRALNKLSFFIGGSSVFSATSTGLRATSQLEIYDDKFRMIGGTLQDLLIWDDDDYFRYTRASNLLELLLGASVVFSVTRASSLTTFLLSSGAGTSDFSVVADGVNSKSYLQMWGSKASVDQPGLRYVNSPKAVDVLFDATTYVQLNSGSFRPFHSTGMSLGDFTQKWESLYAGYAYLDHDEGVDPTSGDLYKSNARTHILAMGDVQCTGSSTYSILKDVWNCAGVTGLNYNDCTVTFDQNIDAGAAVAMATPLNTGAGSILVQLLSNNSVRFIMPNGSSGSMPSFSFVVIGKPAAL
jgi:hypothetical protein